MRVVAAVASATGVGSVAGVTATVLPAGAELSLTGLPPAVVVSFPEIMIGATLVEKGRATTDGDIVIGVTPIFRRFLRELANDPNAINTLDPRQAEELVAGAYEEEGWDEVTLTPRSGDKGRDVIAMSKDYGTIRIVDQVKLFAAHRVVDANDVRALYGVLTMDRAASKGFITTTSTFAPGVLTEFAPVIPTRISLRNGADLRKWLEKFTHD